MGDSRAIRGASALVFLCQLLLVLAVPLADMNHYAPSNQHQDHIQSEQGGPCDTAHGADCQFARAMGSGAGSLGDAPAFVRQSHGYTRMLPAAPQIPPRRILPSSQGPRAPPLSL